MDVIFHESCWSFDTLGRPRSFTFPLLICERRK
jgi:hypothetical protein